MGKVKNLNITHVADAIRLACRTMSSVFNADDDDIPFFGSRVRPEASLGFSSVHSEAHVPGRHLNALLNAEDAAGIRLDEDAVDKHARAAFFSYGGALPLPLNRDEKGGALVNFVSHNVREGLHALYALTKYRRSAQARAIAEASIAVILEYWDPEKGWDSGRLEGEHGLHLQDSGFIPGLARALGPLVKFYRATGYGSALELAIVLKERALDGFFPADGSYDPSLHGHHTHSTTCVMSSLAQLADLTADSHLMNRVKAFYDNGLREISDDLGWVIEGSRSDANPDRGEVNNTGDILETALILGHWGYAQYYHHAERILRGHLLPSQLRDISFIVDPPNPENEDGKRDVANRHLGAFGFPAPYGHHPIGLDIISFNMDIVGGAVGSLCEAYREITRFDSAGHWVNLLFDHETEFVEVQSPYTECCLRVRIKRPAPLFVRIPPWVDADGTEVSGAAVTRPLGNGYLFVPKPPVNRFVSVKFPLCQQQLTLAHRTRNIRLRLRGDEVVAMDNFGADLTFFDPFE